MFGQYLGTHISQHGLALPSSHSNDGSSQNAHPDMGTCFVLSTPEAGIPDRSISLANMIETTREAALFIDQSHRVRCWNQGAEEMFQYPEAEVLGRDVDFLLPPDLLVCEELDHLREICDQEGVLHNYVTRRVRKDGSQFWVSLTRTVVHDEAGGSVGAVAILRDISEQRSGEFELRRSRGLAMVGELAAKVAHEVKNPLAGIFAALQVLEGTLEGEDPRREVFASIGDEVIRLDEITQSLLSFARPVDPKVERCDVSVFLEDLIADLERLAMIEPGLVVVDLEPNSWVRMDANMCRDVFKNLLLNAAQALGGKGKRTRANRIIIRAATSNEVISVQVRDNGPGVPMDERPRIFEPFFTTKTHGTGLGLAIARKNMEAQGGALRLCGQRSGGATFLVDIPR